MTEHQDLDQWEYKIASCVIMYKDEQVEIANDECLSLKIERDYDNDHFPLMELTMRLSQDEYRKMVKNKLTTKIRLKLTYYLISEDRTTGSVQTQFNKLFYYVMDEDDPFTSEALLDEATAEDVTDAQQQGEQFSFYIYPYKEVLGSKTAVNKVLRSVNVNTALAWILSKVGYEHLLWEKADNTTVYPELLIPPLTAESAIEYIQSHFGVYKNGMTYFHDIDRTYLMAKRPKCKVFSKKDYKRTIVTVMETTGAETFENGSIADPDVKEYTINAQFDSVKVDNQTISNDLINGNISVVTNPFTGKTKTVKPKTKQIGKGTRKFFNDYSRAGYGATQEKFALNESTHVLSFSASSFEMNVFKPNMEFQVRFENKALNKKYGGSYRLVYSNILITTNSISGDFVLKGGV